MSRLNHAEFIAYRPTWIVYNVFGDTAGVFHAMEDLMDYLRTLDPKDTFYVYKYGYGQVTHANPPQELRIKELLG